jgi:hypothetical protein
VLDPNGCKLLRVRAEISEHRAGHPPFDGTLDHGTIGELEPKPEAHQGLGSPNPGQFHREANII